MENKEEEGSGLMLSTHHPDKRDDLKGQNDVLEREVEEREEEVRTLSEELVSGGGDEGGKGVNVEMMVRVGNDSATNPLFFFLFFSFFFFFFFFIFFILFIFLI